MNKVTWKNFYMYENLTNAEWNQLRDYVLYGITPTLPDVTHITTAIASNKNVTLLNKRHNHRNSTERTLHTLKSNSNESCNLDLITSPDKLLVAIDVPLVDIQNYTNLVCKRCSNC